jgi:hypothetical protein
VAALKGANAPGEGTGDSRLQLLTFRHQTLAGRPGTRLRDPVELTGCAG